MATHTTLTKRQITKLAKDIVAGMLSGRCLPEDSDIEWHVDDDADIEPVKDEVKVILDRLIRSLS